LPLFAGAAAVAAAVAVAVAVVGADANDEKDANDENDGAAAAVVVRADENDGNTSGAGAATRCLLGLGKEGDAKSNGELPGVDRARLGAMRDFTVSGVVGTDGSSFSS
jgi:hypothetical protein